MKKMCLLMCMAVIAMPIAMSTSVRADDSEKTGWFGFTAGYEALQLHGITYSHDTHPDDSFLPNSGVPGSAGKTTLDGKTLSYAKIGVRFQTSIVTNLVFNLDAGGLLGGGNRDDHQNANDPRPAACGSFVYSKASEYGFYGGAGLEYRIKGFSIGVDGELVGISIESGWDRFGRDQKAQDKLYLVPLVGPRIGYQFMENLKAEGAWRFGQRGDQSVNLNIVFTF